MLMFILSTFMVQIVILNMLIAIMGDTYDKVQDQLQETILIERLSILGEHLPTVGYNVSNSIFIIKPLDAEVEEVDWGGRLKDIKAAYNKTSIKIENLITHKIQQSLSRVKKENKTLLRTMGKNLERIDRNSNTLENQMQRMRDQLQQNSQAIHEELDKIGHKNKLALKMVTNLLK